MPRIVFHSFILTPRPVSHAIPALGLILAVALAACGGGGDSTGPNGPGPGTPPPPLAIAVSAANNTVPAAGTVVLTATLTGGAAGQSAAGVRWRTSGGTITASGTSATLTAPPVGGPITVIALAIADSTRRATVSVTVTSVQVSIAEPTTTRLVRGVQLAEPMRAVVSGAAPGRDSVSWSATCGSIMSRDANSADYTAPTAPGACVLTAQSTLDPAATAQRAMIVRDAWLVTTLEDDAVAAATCTASRCTLRAALHQAGLTSTPDTIVLGDARFGHPLTGAIELTSALPLIETPIHVEGPGSAILAIDAKASASTPRNVLMVDDGGHLTVHAVTLRGGVADVLGGGAITVKAFGKLALQDVVLRDNHTPGGNGGALTVGNNGEATLERVEILGNSARFGGGVNVDSDGTLIASDSYLADNVAEGLASSSGGAIHTFNATVILTDVIAERNRAERGGGVNITMSPGVARSTELTRVTVRDNVSSGVGGGLRITGGRGARVHELLATGNRAGTGGGMDVSNSTDLLLADARIAAQHDSTVGDGGLRINNGSATVRDVMVEDNVVTGGVAGVSISGGAVVTFERVIIRRNRAATTGGMSVTGTGTTLTMMGGEVAENVALTGSAGGINVVGSGSLTLHDVTIRGNTAGTTGGAVFQALGTLSMDRSRIDDNRAGSNGGAIYTTSQGTLSINGSTFSGNEAANNGGALYTFVGSIRNSTFSANRAGDGGSAIVAMSGIGLTNVTIADHRMIGTGNGTAILFAAGSPTILTNTLLARNRSGDDSPRNCSVSGGSVVSGGHNLSDDASCIALTATGDLTNIAAALADSLADNGGPTRTYLPLAGSPAINAGLAAACTTNDQRGAPRVGVCDIGASEFGSAPSPTQSSRHPIRPANSVSPRASRPRDPAPR